MKKQIRNFEECAFTGLLSLSIFQIRLELSQSDGFSLGIYRFEFYHGTLKNDLCLQEF